MTTQIINLIPDSLIDDFFFFGFLGGLVSYLYYRLINKERKTDPNTQSDRSFWIALYGTVLSGCVGGLLAIVFDRAIELSILVGFLHHILYTSIIKSAKDDHFLSVLKEILIKYLTAGKQA